jgi:hypothetical protein
MCVGFEVFTAVSTKMAVFWVVAPCSLVDDLAMIALMMEADAHPLFLTLFLWESVRK